LLSEQEVLLLINHARQPYKSILALAYECRLRRSEILLLKIKDIVDCSDYLKIFVRNSKTRLRIVVVVQFRDILQDWLRRHPFKKDPEAFLFPKRTVFPYEPPHVVRWFIEGRHRQAPQGPPYGVCVIIRCKNPDGIPTQEYPQTLT